MSKTTKITQIIKHRQHQNKDNMIENNYETFANTMKQLHQMHRKYCIIKRTHNAHKLTSRELQPIQHVPDPSWAQLLPNMRQRQIQQIEKQRSKLANTLHNTPDSNNNNNDRKSKCAK